MGSKRLMVMIILVLVVFCGQLTAEEVVGESIFPNIETPHPYPKAAEDNTLVWSTTIHEPGAAWIKIHFSEFRLNDNDYVLLIDMNGKVIERINGKEIEQKRHSKFNVKTDDKKRFGFWGPAVDSDKVIIQLHRASDKKTGWGFTIDEVGIGCKPILDIGLGPIYDTEEKVDISIIPFCNIEPGIVEVDYRGNTIDTLDSPLGRMLYKKGNNWFTCKGSLSAFGDVYLVPGEPVIDCQEVVDTTEVRFYCRDKNKEPDFSVYFTYYGDIYIDDYSSSYYGMLRIRNNHQWKSIDEEAFGKNLDMSKLYSTPSTYYCEVYFKCFSIEFYGACECPCEILVIGVCAGYNFLLYCSCL